MNLKEFYRLVVVDDNDLAEWNKTLEDITVKIRLIDNKGETIKDYNFESGAYFDMQFNDYLDFDTFVIEIKE